ncbi:amidohydrolase [Nocardioides sp. GXQ0305]|uniref:amidohydrolase n=1 Tax=Nocardioides sp. GXQ0305 TaxID=3423912 RepID=UPI003D7E2E27
MKSTLTPPWRGAVVLASTLVLATTATIVASAGPAQNTRPAAAPGSVDMVLLGGKISTLDESNRTVSALAVEDGRIVRVGTDKQVRKLAGAGTRVVQLQGRRVIPGLIEGHLHALRTGYHCWTQTVRLDQVTTRAAALQAHADKAAELPDGAWIWTTAGGWNIGQLDDSAPFTLAELSAAAPDNPVWVTGSGITGARVNQAALDAAGLTASSPGVEVDGSGNPTGGISGAANTTAGATIRAQLDQLGIEGEAQCLSDFLDEAASRGLTSIKDAGGNNAPWGTTGAISDGLHGEEPGMYLYRNEGLPVRIAYHQMSRYAGPVAAMEDLRNAVGFLGDDWFKYLGPGEDTMATDAGYSDFTTMAARKQLSLETHVGDIEAILAGFEAAASVAPVDGLEWRIAHPADGQPSDEQIARAKALDAGWILTFSSVRNGADGPRYRSVLEQDGKFCLASDAMNVAPWQPFQNLWYVTTGQTMLPGVEGVPADQRLSRLEALRHQTVECDWTIDQEGQVGSLEVGKLADLLVLDQDYFQVPAEDIRSIRPLLTVVGGEVSWSSGPYRNLR